MTPEPQPGTPVAVNVLVAEGHLAAIEGVAAALAAAGLRGGAVLGGAGVITGTTDDPARLEAVAGVDAVEIDRAIQLPPPDAPVQ